MDIERTTFEGLEAYQVVTDSTRLIVVTQIGPRIASFGKVSGRNLLFWDSKEQHRRGAWILRGGHRIWMTRPWADETEEAYLPDSEECDITIGKHTLQVSAAPDLVFKLRKTLTIKQESSGSFLVENTILNQSDMLWSGGVWSLTATLPNDSCSYGIPLGDGTDWDVFNVVVAKKWAGHTSPVNDKQIEFTEDCLVIHPQGRESKRMLQAPRGVIGMTDRSEKITFIKQTPYYRDAKYPLGTNIAFYIGPKNMMVEMESMSAQKVLRPADQLVAVERWVLTPAIDWTKTEEIEKWFIPGAF